MVLVVVVVLFVEWVLLDVVLCGVLVVGVVLFVVFVVVGVVCCVWWVLVDGICLCVVV